MQQDTPFMWLIINKLSATLNYHNLLSALIGNSSYIKKSMALSFTYWPNGNLKTDASF